MATTVPVLPNEESWRGLNDEADEAELDNRQEVASNLTLDDYDDEEEPASAMDWPLPDGMAPPEDDAKMQRKLHLFRVPSVQQSIRRLWHMLPRDEHGELRMEGYVELNLRLQKCLTKDFSLERAVDSAIGDWSEDVREGQQAMAEEEFAMFIFELCSLWCGPTVSLRAYLLFLNATFIAVTDARGAHTIGLKPLEAVERLPKAFFDLVSMQGWSKQPVGEEAGMDEEQALKAWYARNSAPDSEQAAILQIQRQVFQVTHDARAVLLFRYQDGKQQGEVDVLELVKHSTNRLATVSQPLRPDGLPSALPRDRRARAGPQSSRELCAQPWRSANASGPPRGPPVASGSAAQAAVAIRNSGTSSGGAVASTALVPSYRRGYPSRQTQAVTAADKLAAHPEAPPLGRAFDSRPTAGRARGLALTGHLTLGMPTYSMPDGTTPTVDSDPIPSVANMDYTVSGTGEPTCSSPARDLDVEEGASELEPDRGQGGSGTAASAPPDYMHWFSDAEEATHPAASLDTVLAQVTDAVDISKLVPPYKLPRNPAEIYHLQTHPLMKPTPAHIVYQAKGLHDQQRKDWKPFERVVGKLPEAIRPDDRGPETGPMAHPNEPIWCEMSHRLQTILKKQGRRAERRRKRKLRSKLFGGRGRAKSQASKISGRALREYLDQAAKREKGLIDGGDPHGEFLGRVQEQYLVRREALESRAHRFHIPGIHSPRNQQARVVRPVYMPPPPEVAGLY